MTYQPPNDLSGTVAIVSGASRGIGRIYALALAKAGAKVLATARTVEGDPAVIGSLAELVATAKAEGIEISACKVDMMDRASIEAAVASCIKRYGRLDALVNNAVWTVPSRVAAMGISDDDWEAAFRINVLGPYRFTDVALPHLMAQGGGSVVNLTSLAARHMGPASRSHGFPSYAVTKAALERMTNYLGPELGEKGVVINAISPGSAEWYMRDGRQPDLDFWGSPVVHLAAQRAPDGINGEIVHTFEFGTHWGPEFPSPPQRDERLVRLVEASDTLSGYFRQR
jgi:3-oxoacyl-[acyl-carrier protein] reductase